ncbi:MAG: Carboxy-terminal-processing protease [Candidatus Nomurabacteria bacterium GW2011_GWB1_37_5]|uniref:Carboxy-terminal-processing protease n=1 Tax=Candidatus Nomurabacteria bacterium GW2011_GWB1_37_5 TaxID=1618742 RepID=A0A0G0GZG3_9BACT|nr:MAG: Carboxy-terminal-processing protease [Candidatus Nomurabacteria bacterium GW2011_GWB1_37_5]
MQKIIKKITYAFFALVIFAGFFLLGVFVGVAKQPEISKINNVSNKEIPTAIASSENIDFDPFWKAWNIINEKYPNVKPISGQDKVWGAISGLAGSLNDPYTVFFPPQENKLFKESINGEFGGVGMEVGMKDKILTVIAPLKDTPAFRAGIKSGDKIIKIDDKSTADMSVDKAVSLIRGETGTKVTLTVIRDEESEPLEISIIREIIKIPTLETEKRSDGIFVIKLYNFSINSPSLFRKALKEFALSKSTKMILDMRGNPGGFLEASIDIASWFLPIGKSVVIEDFGDKLPEKIHRSKGYDIFNKNFKLIVLVDGGSASASEILAGALKDHGVGLLVGEKTFGKGSVQELIDITPDTALKITIAKWLTPGGTSISEQGLKPDIEVKITKEDIDAKRDPQMDKAIEILK